MCAIALAIVVLAASACGRTVVAAPLDAQHDVCAFCRMIVSDAHRASQIAAPYEEPLFFDDLSCLTARLASAPLPEGVVIFVADHRTGAWTRAESAVFTRIGGTGAMGSNVIAHASEEARRLDPDAAGGIAIDWASVLSARPHGEVSRD
jgi:copper chaperone NosL